MKMQKDDREVLLWNFWFLSVGLHDNRLQECVNLATSKMLFSCGSKSLFTNAVLPADICGHL